MIELWSLARRHPRDALEKASPSHEQVLVKKRRTKSA
jgi:hypothetical protein